MIDQLNQHFQDLCSIKKYDESISSVTNLISDAILQLEEANNEIGLQLMGIEFDSEELQSIEERMNALESLKRKYGGSIESVLNQRKNINNEIKTLRQSNKLKHEIIKEIEVKEKMYSLKALSLHKKRESKSCLLYTSPSPRDATLSRMPSSA